MAVVRDLASADDGKELKAVAKAYLTRMKRGSFPHAKEYIEREEGKVPDRFAGHDGKELAVKIIRGVTMDEL